MARKGICEFLRVGHTLAFDTMQVVSAGSVSALCGIGNSLYRCWHWDTNQWHYHVDTLNTLPTARLESILFYFERITRDLIVTPTSFMGTFSFTHVQWTSCPLGNVAMDGIA